MYVFWCAVSSIEQFAFVIWSYRLFINSTMEFRVKESVEKLDECKSQLELFLAYVTLIHQLSRGCRDSARILVLLYRFEFFVMSL